MRTTLTIDDDVLQAAKELARASNTTIGRALSDLARRGLRPQEEAMEVRNGVPLLPHRPGETVVTLETVNRLRDEE